MSLFEQLNEVPKKFVSLINQSNRFKSLKVNKEGTRNSCTASYAGKLWGDGLEKDEVWENLQKYNYVHNQPPLEEGELHSIFKSITSYPKGEQKTFLEKALQTLEGVSLYQDSLSNTFASFWEGKVYLNCRIESKLFRSFLRKIVFKKLNKSLSKKVMADLIDHLVGIALTTGEKREFFVRTYKKEEDRYYYDIADSKGNFIEITQDGWCVKEAGKHDFTRPPGSKPLPVPSKNYDLDKIKKYFHEGCEPSFLLLLSYLIKSMAHSSGPYPILCFMGQQGTGKSWKSRAVKALVDPSKPLLRSPSKKEKDIALYANSNWLMAMDNLSSISNSMSDIFCRLSTGGGFATRKLYSDDEEFILEISRPVLINGINSVTSRGDFLERALIIELGKIKERKPEKELDEEFEVDKPVILGTLLTIFSKAVAEKENVILEDPPRMADFALWGCAVERALGYPQGTFITAYEDNVNASMETSLEKDLTAIALIQLIETKKGGWETTMQDLFDEIQNEYPDTFSAKKYTPKTPGKLSEYLKRIAPLLYRQGIEIKWRGRMSGGRKGISVILHSQGSHGSL